MGRNGEVKLGPRHLAIPDPQCKPGVPLHHLQWLGEYVATKLPDVIVNLGDWFDLPSLSSYDAGKRASHGRRYRDDIEAGNRGLEIFEKAYRKYAPRSYRPRKVALIGNHEMRIETAVENDPKLEGTYSLDDLDFKRHGWEVSPFLAPTLVDGVTYMHYCPLNAKGQVTNGKHGAPSAEAQAKRMMRSTVCGHRQGLDTSTIHTPGRTIRGVIAGSFYLHEEKYLTACGTTYWRGVLVFNDVRPQTGEFDINEVSLRYLERRFG